MQQKVKLTRRQIKEDKFTTFMLTTKSQFLENWQFFVIGVVALILVITAVVYFVNSQASARQEGSVKLANAMASFRNGNTQLAIVGLNEVVDDYSGSQAAEQATFMLGRLNFDQRNYAESIRFYEMYLSKYKDSPLRRAASQAGIAAAHENLGEYDQAMNAYMKAYQEYPDGPMAGQYELSAMRMAIKTGNIDTARQELKSIKENFFGTETYTQAVRIFYEAGLTEAPA
jgi:TolA-binding protein